MTVVIGIGEKKIFVITVVVMVIVKTPDIVRQLVVNVVIQGMDMLTVGMILQWKIE